MSGAGDCECWRTNIHWCSSEQGRLYTCTWGTVWPSLGWSQRPTHCRTFFSQLPTTAFSWQRTSEGWCFDVQQATESRTRSYKPGVGQVLSPALSSFGLLSGASPDPTSPSAEPEKPENTYKVSLTLKSCFLPWWPGSRHSVSVCFCCSADLLVLFRGDETACVSVPKAPERRTVFLKRN